MKNLFLLFILLFTHLLPAQTAPEEEVVPVVVLGGGVGAMSAATYLSRAGISTVVISNAILGGQIIQSSSVQNWPGELEISGVALADKMQKQAEANGARFLPADIVAIDLSKRPFEITIQDPFRLSNKKQKIKAQSCVLALGAAPKLLDIPGEMGEDGYWLRGVYSCAVCDGGLYKGKRVAVVGGGDSALTEAQYLSNIAEKVFVIVRKDQFKTVEESRKNEILKKPNIEILYNTTIQEIQGDGEKMTHLLLSDQSKLNVDALFLAIGSKPNTELLKGQLELDAQGFVVLKNTQETSVPGIFAAGDIADKEFKQAITAAGDGAKAALQAQKFLASYQEKNRSSNFAKEAEEKVDVKEVLTKADLENELKTAKGPVFLCFSSPTCPPCRGFSLYYAEMCKNLNSKITFLKTDASKSLDLFQEYNILAIPTLFIFDEKGNIIRKTTGFEFLADFGSRLETLKEAEKIDADVFR